MTTSDIKPDEAFLISCEQARELAGNCNIWGEILLDYHRRAMEEHAPCCPFYGEDDMAESGKT